ncbi:WGR domain-containing protein [Massilia sp. TN1-12]|uniref:WGR domain-containing protein n=1 Tax=Massilia paldalensis TaxID=3377675 RepID=UPI00384E6CEE
MTYKIDTHYLEHSGGTKFYETVLIQEDNGPGLLIKRWGAIALKNGGGQTKYERGTHSVVAGEANKILREKKKKGYDHATKSGALHSWSGRSDVDAVMLGAMVKQHYGADTAAYVKDYFGLNAAGAVVNEEPKPREPEKPIERGETWGSW